MILGLTTLIDRNGRCIVKCSGFQTCAEVKKNAERRSSRRGGRPLKIVIMHSHVVAHQNFAEKLIAWMQETIDYSSSFRALIGSLLLDYPGPAQNGKNTRLDNFLRNDIILWKSARSSLHHFLIQVQKATFCFIIQKHRKHPTILIRFQAMLLGNDSNRRAFATCFTKNYGQMMKEFINDDHDHSFSVTSLSVQMFTVPTLAHYLIAQQDVLATLFRTFMSEFERKRNDRGKLEFQRHINNHKRPFYILYDIKYLLTTTPDDQKCKEGWTDKLRKGFLHGLSNLLEVFYWMQGMDLQLRQTSQHIDHEFEWQPYFELYLAFIQTIVLITKWCSTDRVVYIKDIRMLFKKLFDDQKSSGQGLITQKIGDNAASCIDYQVSSKPVALHQPLTRFLASLSLYLDKYELNFECNELDIMERPAPNQMMEPSLRTIVFVAQVQAGMWRRNGHTLLDQVTAYKDPRYRKEMEDRDIIMLQLAGSNMDPNDFLINIVNKFQLVNWTSHEFDCTEDDSIRQMNVLAEEFLSSLIYVLGERYIPRVGQVTPEDCIRHEIIQLLCIGPMAHSTLIKALAEDYGNRESGLLDKVVDTVATFKRAYNGATANGKYELKDEFYDQYNVFYYHYSKENQSKSEEAQRHRKKTANEPECNPPARPPRFTEQFQPLLKVMQSPVFLHILKLILDRADNLRSRCFSENQVHKALHLIGLCLLEEERTAGADEENVTVAFTKAAGKFELYEKLLKLVGSQRIESHKDLLNWTLATWQRVAGITMDTSEPITDRSEAEKEAEAAAALQEDKENERKRLAAERRKKVMDQMKNAQKNFMKENKKLFGDCCSRPRTMTETSMIDEDPPSSLTSSETKIQCLGPDRASPVSTDEKYHTCILCQEEEELKPEGQALVTAAFMQKSTVLSNRRNNGSAVNSNIFELALPLLSSDLNHGVHTSSCGHVMHAKCWRVYFEDIQNSERSRTRLRSQQNYNPLRQEFLCPLCRSLSNTVIPLIPQLHTLQSMVFNAENQPEEQKSVIVEMEEDPIFVLSKGNEVDVTQPIRLSFQNWLDALLIAQKYKKELQKESVEAPAAVEPSSSSTSNASTAELQSDIQRVLATATDVVSRIGRGISASVRNSSMEKFIPAKNTMKRFYTCPLDQVVQEMDQSHADKSVSLAFARLFNDQEGQELVFSESLREIIQLFCKSLLRTCKDLNEEELNAATNSEDDTKVIDERAIFEVWNTCAFSIHSAVQAELDGGLSSSLVSASGMSSRNYSCLAALVRFGAVMSSNFAEPKIIRSHSLRLLSLLTEIDGQDNPSILEIDAFGLLVALTFSVPSLFNGDHAAHIPLGNVQDQHLLRLIYIMHLVQIMITTDQFSSPMTIDDQDKSVNTSTSSKVLQVLCEVRDAVGFTSDNDGIEGLDGQNVWNDLKQASIPFLRSVAVFYHHLSGVQGPTTLEHLAQNEHEELCKFLGLPSNPKELFNEVMDLKLARLWASHPAVQATLSLASAQDGKALTFPLKLNSLVQLPKDYSELMNNVSTFSCPNSSTLDGFRVPAMCLICGEILCSQSFCCQTIIEFEGRKEPVGACTAHTR